MTFIVAEIGVNWDGDFDLVKNMMVKSKEVGCDAVKFQSFNEEQIKTHPEFNRLMKTTITKKNIEKIDQIAKEVGIEWFCTPMYPEAIEILNPYVKRFKLREFDGKELVKGNLTLLIEQALKTNKELIISTENTPKNCRFYEEPRIKWLYCVPKYPCSINEVNFENLNDFDGYSNHCVESIVPISAAILGANIIEIHVTMDKNGSFVDNNVSFDFDELRKIISDIRKFEKITI